jgi:hypothetical protein
MAIEQHRERIVTRIRQSVKQSGVDLSGINEEQQERLVSTISDGMLLEMDALLEDIVPAVPAADDPAAAQPLADEQTLWRGRPLLNPFELYLVTNDRVRIFHGMLSKTAENLELVRLQDVDYHQGVSERILGIGDITLRSADASNPVVMLNNVRDPEAVSGLIRKAWLEARKRYGVRFREEM